MSKITANFDETWKEAIGDYLESFMMFFYPYIYQQINWQKIPISLDKELFGYTMIDYDYIFG